MNALDKNIGQILNKLTYQSLNKMILSRIQAGEEPPDGYVSITQLSDKLKVPRNTVNRWASTRMKDIVIKIGKHKKVYFDLEKALTEFSKIKYHRRKYV